MPTVIGQLQLLDPNCLKNFHHNNSILLFVYTNQLTIERYQDLHIYILSRSQFCHNIFIHLLNNQNITGDRKVLKYFFLLRAYYRDMKYPVSNKKLYKLENCSCVLNMVLTLKQQFPIFQYCFIQDVFYLEIVLPAHQ